jgi:pSer/pThr/pTyr-binding forkhead associated (FHA) protein
MRASLIPLDGGPTIELVKEITIIGRKEFCDVRLEDPSVSKVHLIIAKSSGLLLFRDIGSTNGTKVNGQRVVRGMLLPNDKLQIAACKYQVQLLPSESGHDERPSQPVAGSEDGVVRVFKAQDLAHPPRSQTQRFGTGPSGESRLGRIQEDRR